MPDDSLAKLSPDQLNTLEDDLTLFFTTLSPADQDFFAANFNAHDLPAALSRKRELLERSKKSRERAARIKAETDAKAAEVAAQTTDDDLLAAAAAALGIGLGAAGAAISGNTAFYRGVRPSDLVDPLRAEFNSAQTVAAAGGPPEALTVTIFLLGQFDRVAAMTVNLTVKDDGTEVKVNDLSTRGVLAVVRAGGAKLLNVAGQGLRLLSGHLSPGEAIDAAGRTLASSADLAEAVANLQLKERAWKVIRQTAEAIEAAYQDRLKQEREAQAQLEAAWDRYYNCPTCGVAFGAGDATCRVCGAARPDKPLTPDPRQK
ncbi:hypothetical protein LARV_01144 [Longilinea arvoryzae]|uniref:Uncharacterized protein n=1 Tax=Longilinea arvoryzae TaxID=360412 RepID=A0A0S7B7M9_9CHLR|nr:hypothetical protein [Longilinea arvoryzae]GAP13391.1 hypothetical protein LARV_01144 [Longilinea arvoryzae]